MPRPKTKKKKSRHAELEDPPGTFERKCQQLAAALRKSSGTVVYTGAGISTAASIPDYRGPNGVWTAARKGIPSSVKYCDPIQSSPTYSHMALRELYKRGLVQHVLSQNCDGFHLRSGLPQTSLSEIHGNMHIEVCRNCQPIRQYIRPFDVTEKTGFRRHNTGRQCTVCYSQLEDTIVHFGEFGKARWPLNWEGVMEVLGRESLGVILCLGSSLQIVQKYKHLWCEDRPKHLRPKLFVVNLQWTPKDRIAKAKINGKCDKVMQRVMEILNLSVPAYCRNCDTVLNARHRNTRNKELMTTVVSCTCKFPLSDSPNDTASKSSMPGCSESSKETTSSSEQKVPGWWKVGLHLLTSSKKSMSKLNLNGEDSAKAVNGKKSVGRGRPRKRKTSEDDSEYFPTTNGRIPTKKSRGRPKKCAKSHPPLPMPSDSKLLSKTEGGVPKNCSKTNGIQNPCCSKERSPDELVESVVDALHESFQKNNGSWAFLRAEESAFDILKGITHKLDEQFVKHEVSEFSMEWNPNVELSSACGCALERATHMHFNIRIPLHRKLGHLVFHKLLI